MPSVERYGYAYGVVCFAIKHLAIFWPALDCTLSSLFNKPLTLIIASEPFNMNFDGTLKRRHIKSQSVARLGHLLCKSWYILIIEDLQFKVVSSESPCYHSLSSVSGSRPAAVPWVGAMSRPHNTHYCHQKRGSRHGETPGSGLHTLIRISRNLRMSEAITLN